MKMNNKNFMAGWTGMIAKPFWLKGAVMLLAVLMTLTGKAQTNFASALLLAGDWGSATNTNVGVVPDHGAPNTAGYAPNAPLWYQWTASADGVVEVDTIGSSFLLTNVTIVGINTTTIPFQFIYATNVVNTNIDTVLGVYTGSSLASLSQVAANDDLFPVNQTSVSSSGRELTQKNISDSADSIGLFGFLEEFENNAPFYGPSGLRFNAIGGRTYYFEVDSKVSSVTGPIQLNWAYKPSGVFRFASEDVDPTTGLLLYQTAETESDPPDGTDNTANSVVLTYYNYNAPGVLVTVTRVAGSTGRATVNYTTVDGTNLALGLPNDTPAIADLDYVPVSGTLVFDDYEMSKTILIPIIDDPFFGQNQSNLVFGVQLIDDGGVTSPLLDPNESAEVSAPRVDPNFGTAMVRILNSYADPYGPDEIPMTVTNPVTMTPYVTNVPALDPTNCVFNFEKSHYRVPADVNDGVTSPWTQVTLWVERYGTNTSAQTFNYRVDNYLGNDSDSAEERNIYFPLQPGSDYAVPTPAFQSPIRGTNSDFVMTQGTVSFPGSGNGQYFQPIRFTVPTSTLTKFNKDFKVQLYQEQNIGGTTVPRLVGMVNEATVTILFNDENPPAGSVDEFHNADFNSLMAVYSANVPQTVPPNDSNPGVGLYGEVYGMALLTNNEVLLGGDFQSYNGLSTNGISQACVALVNTNGQLDIGFYPGSGANAAVNAVALSGSQFYVGGSFASFNGRLVGHIARLNADGSVDTSFNPGLGADDTVRALTVLTNGEVLIAGDFTHINGTPCEHIALLNTAGVLDTGFNPGNNINGSVYALALSTNAVGTQQVVVGGGFTVAGEAYRNIARLNLDGSIDTGFNPGTGADGVVHGLAIQSEGQILVAGEFTHFSGSSYNRLVRLIPNGSLDSTNFFIGTGADSTVFCVQPVTVTTATNYVVDINNNIIATNYTYATSGIYIGGAFASVNGTHRLGFARLYENGNVDTTFMDTAYNQFAGLKRIFSTDTPAVLSTAIQPDGNILIGGSFNQVGGGQALTNAVNSLDDELFIGESFADPNLWVEPKTRDGVRNRSGFARLIGGATPGPGNVGFNQSTFSANKSQTSLSVSLVRTNGDLGPVAANFVIQPELAQSGFDYNYVSGPPIFWTASQFTVDRSRERTDGLSGYSGFLFDPYGLSLPESDLLINQASEVTVSIINNKASSGNLDAQFQLANPSGADTFYLGGENIPLGTALGVSSAPFVLVDDTSYPGTFSFNSPTYVATNLSAAVSVVRSNGLYGVVTMKYSTANGTALAGSDYIGLTNQNMVFAQSQTTNGFSVTIKNDGYITNVERTVNLKLSNIGTTPGATFGITNAVLRIINPNFQGYVTLGATNYLGAVSSGVLNFAINRISGSYGTITVQYATTNGTAINGIDYVGMTNTLTWNSGDVASQVISIPLLNPGVVGTGNKQFGVNLFNPTYNSAATPALFGLITNSSLTISNNNNAGTLQLSAASYIVNENGGYATISVVRTGGAVGSLSAHFATSDATAFARTNYVATNGVITLAAGQTSTSFTVPILNDGVVDPPPANFYFNVTLASATSTNSAIVEIVDAQSYNLPPGSPDPDFNTNGMNGDVLALALQTNGQILAGGNFTAVGPTPVGSLARINTDGSLDTSFLDGLAGANAAVNSLAIQTDGRILLGGAFTSIDGIQRNYLARIMTDGTLDTSFNPGSGADNTVDAVVETFIGGVRRVYIGGAFGTVNGSTSPGLARLDADPADNKNDGAVDGNFNIGSGFDGQVYAIAVYPTNSIYSGKVLVGGSFAHYNSVLATNLVRLNVDGSLDTNFNANLGSGPNDIVQALTIQLGGQVLVGGRFTNFNSTVINHLCRLNTDGTLDTNFVAALGAGTDGSVSAITLQPDDRILVAGNFGHANGLTRNHITRLLPTGAADPTINFGGGANGNIDAMVVQPADDYIVIGGAFTAYDGQSDPGIARIYGGSETGSGAFSFSSGTFEVNENGVFAPITIIRTGGTSGTNADGSGVIAVQFAAAGGSAVPVTNYAPVSTTVDFPAGEVQETVLVPVFDDGVITSNLTVNLTLANETPPATNGTQPTATLIIVNVDSAIAFSTGFYTQAKNTQTGVAVIDVLRLGGTNDTTSVAFSTGTNGTAIIGTDYYPTNATLTFAPGVSDVQIQVPIINNTLIEGNRTVNLILTNVVNTILTSPSNALLTIIDTVAAPGQLFFSADNFTAAANQGVVELPVLRTNGSSGSVSVSYNLIAGTAQPGINYVAASGTITFGAGVTSASVPVQLVNSPAIQAPVSLTVALANPTGGATLTGPASTTLTILNTNAVFNFTQATNTATEDAQTVTIVVQRYNSINLLSTVQFGTTNGTAVAGVNYSNTTGTLVFAPGQVSESFSVPLINQSNTVSLQFGVNLFNPVNGFVVAPSNTVVIVEGSAASVSFVTNSTTVLKNAGSVVITVLCSNPRVEPYLITSNTIPLEVSYATIDGSALAGKNYNAVSGTLLFTNGLGTNTIVVPILNNQIISSNLTFSVVLTNVTAPGVITPYGVETVTIAESNVGLGFSQPAYTVFKNGVFATIAVSRTGYANSVASVDYSVTNGTAIAGLNYYPTNGTLVFTNGVTSQSFNVPIIANSQVQPNLFALLQLSNPTNALILGPAVETLTILENGGSYVIPAGAQVVTNYTSRLHDDIINSNDTVQVLFAFRDIAGFNVTNLIAYLQATNGVLPGTTQQTYGPLQVNRHSVSEPFTFTAHGTNNLTISPTFQLYDNVRYIGPAAFVFTVGSLTTTFANTNRIIINVGGAAAPYPSLIDVTGLGSTLIKATVTLTNLSHGSIGDIEALVVSPSTNTLIMAHAGGGNGSGVKVSHVTLTFDDAATNAFTLPPNGGAITNRPAQNYPVVNFP